MLLQAQELFLIGRVYKKRAILKKELPLTDFWCFDEIYKYTSLIYVFFKRPAWFQEYVKDIYDIKEP